MAELDTVDPVAVMYDWLAGHPDVLAAFGGTEHVTGVAEAPWPHLVVTEGPSADMREVEWAFAKEVLIEVHDDPAGSYGPSALWRLSLLAARAAKEIVEREQPFGEPVISRVQISGGPVQTPLTTGGLRSTTTLLVTAHPRL